MENEAQEQGVLAKLVIRRLVNGQLTVEGPINDKMTCYALLEGARDAIYEYSQRQPVSPLALPPSARL